MPRMAEKRPASTSRSFLSLFIVSPYPEASRSLASIHRPSQKACSQDFSLRGF